MPASGWPVPVLPRRRDEIGEPVNGAIGSFESTRFATGRKNANRFEINGDRGGLAFDLERLNELEFLDVTLPPDAQGFRTVLVTEADDPSIAAWWPPGHVIGYEHTFIHAARNGTAQAATVARQVRTDEA